MARARTDSARGIGVEQGASTTSSRDAAGELFPSSTTSGRDARTRGEGYDFAPTFRSGRRSRSPQTAVIWERERGGHDEPFRARDLRLPGGDRRRRVRESRAQEGSSSRLVDCRRVDSHTASARIHRVLARAQAGSTRRDVARARGRSRAARLVAAPCPIRGSGDRMSGKTCAAPTSRAPAGTDGREPCTHQVLDHEH